MSRNRSRWSGNLLWFVLLALVVWVAVTNDLSAVIP